MRKLIWRVSLALIATGALALPQGAAADARFTYEVCDSVLPAGGTPGVKFTANPGVPFTPFNNCASPGGAIGITETGTTSSQFAWWSVPVAATPSGWIESLAVTASACGLGAANDHTFVLQNDPAWPLSECQDRLRVFHVASKYSPWSYGAGFNILINCDGNVGPCGAGPTVAGHYFAATEVDPTPPQVSELEGSLLDGKKERGHQTLAAEISDKGSGLAEAAVIVNGSRLGDPLPESCNLASAHNPSVIGKVAKSPTPCPPRDRLEWNIDTQAYPFHDGANSVAVCGYDLATLGEPNAGCSAPQSVSVDNSCTPSAVDGGEVLSAQFARSHQDAETVGYGKGAEVSGQLMTNAGDPVPGATLCIKASTLGTGSPPATVGTVQTDADGLYTYKVAPGPNRALDIGYRHDSRQVARALRLYSHAGPSLKLAPPVLHNHHAIRLWGELPGPRAGKRVVIIQANVPGSKRWITFRKVTSHGRGGFETSYRFNSTTHKTRYRFRALVPEQAGYPWVEGNSKPARVLVKP
jgi:hypothetical protein